MAETKNRYSQIIEGIFSKYFQEGSNAMRGFLRHALNLLKPVKVPTNVNLGFFDFFCFALFTDLTMNSPDLIPRSPGVQKWIPIFAFLSYFLMALQATVFGFLYQKKLIP
jgi:hypothetical protein